MSTQPVSASSANTYDCRQFFIDGQWVTPRGRHELAVIDPATEQPVGTILLGTAADVDAAMVLNSGQSCNAPSRMLVPESRYDEAVSIAKAVADSVNVGDPKLPGIGMGHAPPDAT